MDIIKRRLSRTRSGESHVSIGGTRTRRGALTAFHFKKTNLAKELQQAVKDGDATKLREILDSGTEFEDYEEVNKAVKVCCEKGFLDMLATLIRFGASVNMLYDNNLAPLHISARHETLSVMNLLVSNGANVNIATKFEKRTPLHMAALSGKVGSVKFLIDVNTSSTFNHKDLYGMTPLHLAAKKGHFQIVSLLLESKSKCDVNDYDQEGWTALHLAAEGGDLEMAHLLLECHAQVDCQNKYGRTPLHWAVMRGHMAMVRLLLQRKASATLKDLHNKCSLDYCKDPEIRQMLVNMISSVIKSPSTESTIGDFLKIDPRESFIRRLGQPLPQVVNTIVSAKKRVENATENLDTIAEETEIGSGTSRRSSDLSEDEAFVDHVPSDDSVTKEKPSFFRALFQSKTTSEAASSAPNSRRNSDRSVRSDFESSYKSTTSSLKHFQPLTSAIDTVSCASSNIASVSSRGNGQYDEDGIPEEAVMGKVHFKTMMARIQRHQQSAESIVNSISTDIAQAVTDRKPLSNDRLMNISNRLHKLQDMMFDFREENDRQAILIRTTMATFLDTIKKRLSPRDVVPLGIQQAFIHAFVKYVSSKQYGWKQLVQRLPNISEEKRSDMLTKAGKTPDATERSSLVVQFVLGTLSESEQKTPLRVLLTLVTKCAMDQNSAQIILKDFIQIARANPEESMHENLFTLSYRLGKDGEALAAHLGVSHEGEPVSPSQRQEHNLGLFSRWRQATVNATVLDCVYDLVEGLIVIGREDLLIWILSNQKRRQLSSSTDSTSSC